MPPACLSCNWDLRPGTQRAAVERLGRINIAVQLATVEGAQTPYPYGGKQRQIQVDIDLHALEAKGLSPIDVVNAISAQNLIAPSGTMKIDRFEYAVETNSSPTVVDELNNLPVKAVNGAVIYVRDVAHVRDGNSPQTNIVRVDGKRAVLMNVMKTGSSSTLDIISGVQKKLIEIKGQLPPQLQISTLSDQSIFVRGAIGGVVREAVIAACLTAIMILIFLGSWRSTIIIAVSIPLSILCSLSVLAMLHETINIMTLGGFALAVGILVDDATVAIENINRNLEAGKELEQSILDGSAQIAVPALVSTLAICIVFVPMFFLSGVASYLFVPMAEAVVFAMLASYLLSRTLVPTMAKYLLKEHDEDEAEKKRSSRNPFIRFQQGFEHAFDSFRRAYLGLLTLCVDHSRVFLTLFLLFAIGSLGLARFLGQDFFPSVDSGSFKIHVRARTGTRIEETAALCDHIDSTIRQNLPAQEIVSIVDNVGLPYSGLNLSYSTSAPIGPADADIQVQLSKEHHPTAEYVERLRGVLDHEYPGVTFYVLPVDIVTQILNFGLSAPIDVQIVGSDLYGNRALAEKILNEVRYVPGAADARIQQPFNYPNMTVDVDRTRAQSVGLTQKDVATSLLVALSGSFQTTPSFYLDPKTGVTYSVAIQAPQYKMDSLAALKSLPVTGPRNDARLRQHRRRAAAHTGFGQSGHDHSGRRIGHHQPLRCAAGHRRLRQCGWHRSGHGHGQDRKDHRRPPERTAARIALHPARPERDHEGLLHWPDGRAGLLDSARLSADRRQLPILARSVHHHRGFAGGAGRHRLVPLPHQHAAQRSRADRGHHVHGRGNSQLHPGGQLCPRAVGSAGGRCAPCGAERRLCPPAPGADDRPGDDLGHGSHGPGPGRRRRAECSAGPRRHRRAAAGHRGHALLCARVFLFSPRLAGRPPQDSPRRAGRGSMMSLTRFRSSSL